MTGYPHQPPHTRGREWERDSPSLEHVYKREISSGCSPPPRSTNRAGLAPRFPRDPAFFFRGHEFIVIDVWKFADPSFDTHVIAHGIFVQLEFKNGVS